MNMTEWLDPHILVAIITGCIGTIFGIGNTAFNIYTFLKQRKQSRNQYVWEEYRETVYDPLSSALRNLEKLADSCRNVRHKDQDQLAFSRSLSEMMNDVEILCVKADNHDVSNRKDWSEQAEAKNAEIFRLIESYELDKKPFSHTDPSLSELEKELRGYVKFFDDRLREQRRALLNF